MVQRLRAVRLNCPLSLPSTPLLVKSKMAVAAVSFSRFGACER
jgi:hypothetical protein